MSEKRKSKKGKHRNLKPFEFEHGETVLIRAGCGPVWGQSSVGPFYHVSATKRYRIIVRKHRGSMGNYYAVRDENDNGFGWYKEKDLSRPILNQIAVQVRAAEA